MLKAEQDKSAATKKSLVTQLDASKKHAAELNKLLQKALDTKPPTPLVTPTTAFGFGVVAGGLTVLGGLWLVSSLTSK